ncbi:phosphoribosyltransferase family protein [Terrilactibacillus sp. S3-3]|nr:phosphoribosyltransferase family protein [Terrilactibacillus sp. S3-3]
METVDGRLQAAREKLKASVRFPDFTAFSLYRNKANEDLTIVPVPLSGERLLERSYNQSRLLAELLGNKVTDALIRRVNEPKQSKKGRRERLEMKENPFRLVDSCRKQLAGRQVLLIDDIYTTGATLRLAAQALQPAGPISIVSLTLAHG